MASLATTYDLGESAWEPKSPVAMASHLARWCNDASTIVATVNNHFGRGRAPQRPVIERMIMDRRKSTMLHSTAADDKKLRYNPDKDLAAEQLDRRPRDYITIVPATPRNPFLERHRLGRAVIEAIAAEYDLTAQDLIGQSRFRRLCYPRALAYRLLVDWGLSRAETGRRMGGRDHSTVIHGLTMFPIYCEAQPELGLHYAAFTRLANAARDELRRREAL